MWPLKHASPKTRFQLEYIGRSQRDQGGFTTFDLPKDHRRWLRTTNVLERLNREIKRRPAVATLFPNEASLMRWVTAMVAEVSDEGEIRRAQLVRESE